jgi:hypothetical protein
MGQEALDKYVEIHSQVNESINLIFINSPISYICSPLKLWIILTKSVTCVQMSPDEENNIRCVCKTELSPSPVIIYIANCMRGLGDIRSYVRNREEIR